MPRKLTDVVSSDGTLDTRSLWTPTPKNQLIRRSAATNRLRVGGTGSSKSSDALMEVVTNYLLRWDGCHALYLRKNLTDLKKSSILDLKEFIPEELYHWHATDFVATFHATGSKLFFGHLQNMSEQDLQQYLSASFTVIVVDECGQFSGEAWKFLQSRNRVNRECKPDEKNQFPKPVMLGCTNPIGPFWSFYKTVFVDKKPWNPDPDAKRATDGRYFIRHDGQMVCIYDPRDYDYIHSTILDNPHLMQRDPDQVRKLQTLPKDKRDKFLYGEMNAISGQFYDCWDPTVHIITQGQIAEQIIWQSWQPRWLGWDWGRVHFNSAVWMTFALVRCLDGEFRQKIVVYREYIDKGKDYRALANTVAQLTRSGLPYAAQEIKDQSRTLDAIYFSHEKFALQMEAQSPAVIMSGHLTGLGLPPARQGTRNRIGRANLLYDKLKTCDIVILDTCPHIIEAIPQLIRDENNLEDVKKLDTEADDVYDGLTLGLFGQLGSRSRYSQEEQELAQRLNRIEDPFWREMQRIKATLDKQTPHSDANAIGADWLLDYNTTS